MRDWLAKRVDLDQPLPCGVRPLGYVGVGDVKLSA